MTEDTRFTALGFADFSEALASKAPVPGGGGASAAVGSLCAALGLMVGNITQGKPKFAAFEEQLVQELGELESLRVTLLELVEKDAEAFSAVSAVYGVPKEDPTRPEQMEAALNFAVQPPLETMVALSRVIDVLTSLRHHSSAYVLSDVGVGAVLAAGAMRASEFGVVANTCAMKDRDNAAALDAQAAALIAKAEEADLLYEDILTTLRGA